MVVLGGWAFSYERGTLEALNPNPETRDAKPETPRTVGIWALRAPKEARL